MLEELLTFFVTEIYPYYQPNAKQSLLSLSPPPLPPKKKGEINAYLGFC